MFLFPILIAGILYFVLTENGRVTRPIRQRDDAMEQLKIRFVQGEIDEETYLKMRRTLER